MDDKDVFKFTAKKQSNAITPLKRLLNLPKQLKDKIVKKSSSLWRHPRKLYNTKRKFNEDNKENAMTNSRKRCKYQQETGECTDIKMAVIHTRYPKSELSSDQYDLIKKRITHSMEDTPQSWGNDLDISNMEFKEGIFIMNCGNRRTVNWVWETVHALGDLEDEVLLRVVEYKYLPQRKM